MTDDDEWNECLRDKGNGREGEQYFVDDYNNEDSDIIEVKFVGSHVPVSSAAS